MNSLLIPFLFVIPSTSDQTPIFQYKTRKFYSFRPPKSLDDFTLSSSSSWSRCLLSIERLCQIIAHWNVSYWVLDTVIGTLELSLKSYRKGEPGQLTLPYHLLFSARSWVSKSFSNSLGLCCEHSSANVCASHDVCVSISDWISRPERVASHLRSDRLLRLIVPL